MTWLIVVALVVAVVAVVWFFASPVRPDGGPRRHDRGPSDGGPDAPGRPT